MLPVLTFIQAEFARRKAKNPRYSVRSFAQALDMSSSALAQILKGTRQLTFTTARHILDRLPVEESERHALLLTFDHPDNYVQPRTERRTLSEQELELMAGWQFYAILCALELPEQRLSPAGIAAQIGCELALVRSSLALLIDLRLVREEPATSADAGPRYVPTGEQLTTSHNLPSPALITAHADYLAKAKEALHTPSLLRHSDFSGITMAIAKDKVPEASRRIREFRRALAAYLADGDKDEVYRINIQLFPLKSP